MPDPLHKWDMPEHQTAKVTVMEVDWAAQEIVPFISDGFREEELLMINDATKYLDLPALYWSTKQKAKFNNQMHSSPNVT